MSPAIAIFHQLRIPKSNLSFPEDEVSELSMQRNNDTLLMLIKLRHRSTITDMQCTHCDFEDTRICLNSIINRQKHWLMSLISSILPGTTKVVTRNFRIRSFHFSTQILLDTICDSALPNLSLRLGTVACIGLLLCLENHKSEQ